LSQLTYKLYNEDHKKKLFVPVHPSNKPSYAVICLGQVVCVTLYGHSEVRNRDNTYCQQRKTNNVKAT